MATALEPGAEPEEISTNRLTDLGLSRIAYSIAISLKRLADATEEMTVAALAPKPAFQELRMPSDGIGHYAGDGGPAVFGDGDFATQGDGWRNYQRVTPASQFSTKTTSPEMAALAARYMGMDDNKALRSVYTDDPTSSDVDWQKVVDLFADIRSLAACVLAQVEPKP